MADILRIKRRASGGAAGAPASLANAELAYNETDHTLYIGEGTGGAGGSATVIVPIGGAGMASNALPAMDGTAAAGTNALLSRDNHVHPSDTSRLALAGGTMSGLLVLSGDPVVPLGACTKQYADNVTQGLDAKPSVKAASTADLTLSGAQTIDGVALVAGDRVLVKDQTTAANNGIYVVAAGTWTRASDADAWGELVSAYTFVEQGTANADSGWVCTVDQSGTLGTTAVPWTQFSGAGQITAGTGLTKTGSTINVIGTPQRIYAYADNIDIDLAWVGQTSITTLGTVTTGTWNATTIAVNRGGTGATTLTGYVKGSGTAPLTASATIPSTDISGLGTMSVQNANAVAITGGSIDGVTLDCGTF
jgi:hypothetical protein